jgi:hypothetical protein
MPCPGSDFCCTPATGSGTECLAPGTDCNNACTTNGDCGTGQTCCPAPQTNYQECLAVPSGCPPTCSATAPCEADAGLACCIESSSSIYGTCGTLLPDGGIEDCVISS